MSNRIRSVIEELCVEMLLPEIKDSDIYVCVEYSEEEANTETIDYSYEETVGSTIIMKLR